MKYAITGHTSGLGKFLYNHWNNSAIGFSRTNGFDISKKTDRDKIIEISKDVDVFINNAYCLYYQTELLYDLYNEWKDEKKIIINIGSNTTDGIKRNIWPYSSHKASLEKASEQLSYLNNNCKVLLIKFGYIGTERVIKDINPKNYISIEYAAQIVNLSIELNSIHRFINMTIIP